MILRISASNQLRVLSFHFMGTIFMLVALYLLKFNIDFVVIFGIWFGILTLPVIYLHIEYYVENREQKIIIDNDMIELISGKGTIRKFKFAELKKIILYKSASMDKGGIPLTPFEHYSYLRIITKSDEQIIITCLMHPKLEEVVNQFKEIQTIRKKRGFCTLKWK